MMLVNMTLKLVNAVFGLDHATVMEDSVTLLKTISVAGSGPGSTNQRDYFKFYYFQYWSCFW